MMRRLLWICCLVTGSAAQPFQGDALFQKALDEMHGGDFAQATADLRGLEQLHPDDPSPACFLAVADLWQIFYDGSDAGLLRSLNANANRALSKADRILARKTKVPADVYFWRGMSRSVEIAGRMAARALGSEARQLDFGALVNGLSMLSDAHSAESDFGQALARNARIADARVMLILFQECRGADKTQCIADLWRSADDVQWVGTEIKYILLNLSYNRRSADYLRSRAVPLAIELHGRYPTNGLFHLAMAKVSYEVGDPPTAAAICHEILSGISARTFGPEAHYLLGMMAGDNSDWSKALPQFQDIIAASPKHPSYLLPWALVRAAQCEEALGSKDAALKYAKKVLASEVTEGAAQMAAQRIIARIGQIHP
jgi:tetratricopeptide (TPR) repeat protein